MTLAFVQVLNGKPTYFPEKILAGIDNNHFYMKELFNRRCIQAVEFDRFWSKPHTIREDAKNRWHTGLNIHFVINNRTKKMYRFAPILKCISTQSVIIKWTYNKAKNNFSTPMVIVDDKHIRGRKLFLLARNDGFDSLEDFFAYFNTDFTGKIIHWTNLKY